MALFFVLGVALISTSFATAADNTSSGQLLGQTTTENPINPASTDQPVTCSTETTEQQTSSTTTTIVNEKQNTSQVASAPETADAPQAAGAPVLESVRAYWIWGSTLPYVDLWSLKNQGITDIFVLMKGTSGTLNYGIIDQAILACSDKGIRVHAWMICFKDYGMNTNGWVDQKNEAYQAYLLGIVQNLANRQYLSGIHLDYVRYSGVASAGHAAYQNGGTEVITDFVSHVRDRVDLVRSQFPDNSFYLSAAVMPIESWIGDNEYYYGQDYAKLSQYLDFLVPMIYEGNFHKDNAWIASTTSIIVNAVKIPVIAGLQNYHGDDNIEMLSADELQADINSALANGAKGYAIFRATVPRWSTYQVAIPYKKVRYRAKIKKVYKVRTRRGYKYRVRYVRVWRYKWLYTYKTYGHWIMGK